MHEEPEIMCVFCDARMERQLGIPAFRINGYFTSATGYSKDPEYAKAVEGKRKKERKEDGNI